jgi:hypothetical protein
MSTANYTLEIDGGSWVILKTDGSLTQVMPRRFPWRRLTDARKYVAQLNAELKGE